MIEMAVTSTKKSKSISIKKIHGVHHGEVTHSDYNGKNG